MSEPLFTVVMPTRDRAALLPAALRSLLWQTCGDFECIVMDDGSRDATPDVFKRFSGDPRFSWHRFEGRGAASCRNFALERARGLFIAFLDDDDLWLPSRLEKFRDAMRERPSVAFWFSNAYVWRCGRVVGRMFDPSGVLLGGRRSGYYAGGDRSLPFAATNLSIAREAFERVGPYHEGIPLLSDTDMCARILGAGFEAGVLPEPLAVRRRHDPRTAPNRAYVFEESATILESSGLADDMRDSLLRDLALRIAGELLERLEGRKMQGFLRRAGIERDSRYWLLYAAGFLPRWALSLLRRARKAYLTLRYQPRFAGKEFREIDELVRPLL